MSRPIALLCCGCLVAIGATGYGMIGDPAVAEVEVPGKVGAAAPRSDLANRIDQGRRSCQVAAMDAVITELQHRTSKSPDDAEGWHLLASAALSRLQTRTALRGIAVGTPLYDTLPSEVVADIDLGLAAVDKARALGDDSGDLYRLEAGLLGQRITGLGSALQWNGRIQQALAKAVELIPEHPKLHLALGLRKLLAPRFLGHDPAGALEHLQFAAEAMPEDERPALFAAMALHLQDKRQQAITWLEQAVSRNPDNPFARAVLERVRRDEQDPFGRDLTVAEIAAPR